MERYILLWPVIIFGFPSSPPFSLSLVPFSDRIPVSLLSFLARFLSLSDAIPVSLRLQGFLMRFLSLPAHLMGIVSPLLRNITPLMIAVPRRFVNSCLRAAFAGVFNALVLN